VSPSKHHQICKWKEHIKSNALPASRSDMLLLSLSKTSVETRDSLQTQQALTPSNPTLAMSLSLFSTTIAELRLVTWVLLPLQQSNYPNDISVVTQWQQLTECTCPNLTWATARRYDPAVCWLVPFLLASCSYLEPMSSTSEDAACSLL
jgi:hypothetical protein